MSRILVIGNRNYSSWSLRARLALKAAGVHFEELRIPLDQPQTKAEIRRHSPSGRVPCLIDGPMVVWDSLAICETASEWVDGRLWPAGAGARAHARAVTAEMHSGFAALRTHLPMDIRSRRPDQGAMARRRDDVAADIERICAIWSECLARSGGPLLYGSFCIADAFYAPVVTRYATYDVTLPPPLAAYAQAVLDLPAMREWTDAAHVEPEVLVSP